MRRFVISFLLITMTATAIWWIAHEPARQAAVAGAKWLHAAIGYPAPYLQADHDEFYWHAPLFPPLVGLILASTWIPIRQRLIGLAVGLIACWYVVSLQIALIYSPYLTESAIRGYLSEIYMALNGIIFPVLLWLIATAGPPRTGWTSHGQNQSVAKTPTPSNALPVLRIVGLTLVLCAACTLPIQMAVSQTTPRLSLARDRLATALQSDDIDAALSAIGLMFSHQRSNTALSYLRKQLENIDSWVND